MFFQNGRILTMDREQPEANFVEIIGNQIAQIDFEGKEINADDVIDLTGKTLLPGLIDTHLHLLNYGLVLKAVKLRGCNSIAELLERIQERVAKEAEGTWIFGRGWDENRYDGLLPNRKDLDQIAPNHPLILSRVCGHLIVVNSKTLEVLGINENTIIPEGGVADRDQNGKLTGVFREMAMEMIFAQLPKRSMEEIEEALKAAGQAVLAVGITTVHTDDLGGMEDLKLMIELYQKLWKERMIPRSHLHIHHEHIPQARELGLKTGDVQDGITIGSVKIFADGSLGARTAAMLDDYSDAPGYKGILVYSDEELYQMVKDAQDADFAVAIHGIGDAAIDQGLRIISRVQDENPKTYLRHRIVHAQILNEELMDKMVQYNVIGEIQPVFITTDLHWAESRVGERIQTSYNWQTMLKKGIHLTGSSDCPVEAVNPMYGIYCAVTRKDLEGCPVDGWYPEEGLTLEQALHLFTIGGAYTGGNEQGLGTIEIGKIADLVILDRPIDQISPVELKEIQVEMTIIDGRVVYHR